ncbi:DUF4386 domain-containing protein [Microbacterium awajiense]|uniref:DUF4386 domain-containing protein n=1 Tax=Microbacterium awajiense TaxID=415214 RepID=A0ABP7AH39_9MICO
MTTATATTAAIRGTDTPSATAALWAGIGYAILFVAAIAANFGVVTSITAAGDPTAMVDAIAADPTAFRFTVLAFGVIFVLDVVIAWGLHVLLRPTGEMRSLLAAWMRLAYTVLLGVAVGLMHLAGQVATGALPVTDATGTTALLMAGFDITWIVGLAAFGVHLLVIGWILVRSRVAPRILGIGLMIAGAAYIADTVAHLLVADYTAIADVMLAIVAVPSMLAELGLTVWLFLAARRVRTGRPLGRAYIVAA